MSLKRLLVPLIIIILNIEDKDKTLIIRKYRPYLSRPYLSDRKIDYKTQKEWKIQLAIAINFTSSKDFDEIRTMQTKSYNIEIMMGSETDEIIVELFKSLLQRYQKN